MESCEGFPWSDSGKHTASYILLRPASHAHDSQGMPCLGEIVTVPYVPCLIPNTLSSVAMATGIKV